MKHITVRCVNEQCREFNVRKTIPEGRPVAPGVTEKLGHLICDDCRQDTWQEPA